MESFLFTLTSIVNFLCLALSLWLGFYIVTHSPRSRVSWLAGATLWSLSGSFLNTLTYINVSPEQGALPWWWGWSAAFAAPFWFHLSVSLLPSKLAQKQRPLVILVYLLTLNFVAMEAYTPWVFAGATMKPAIYNSAQSPGPLFPLFGLFLIVVPALAFYNLRLSWKRAQGPTLQRQLALLLWATALAILGGGYANLSTWLGLDTPTLVNALSLGTGVALLGYGVARYNALIEGRAIGRDFLYTSLAIGSVTGVYLLVALISYVVYDVPFIAFIFVIILAIVSHSLYDWARTYLDRLFYRQQHRELRANLRDFAREAALGHDLPDQLQVIIQTLCRSLDAGQGFIALREAQGFAMVAAHPTDLQGTGIAVQALATDEITALCPPLDSPQLAGMVLLVPMHYGGEQIGAVVLGPKTTGSAYTEDDLDLLDDLAQRVASVVHNVRLQEKSVQQIDALVTEFRQRERELRLRMQEMLEAKPPTLEGMSERELVSLVEDALRHLYDYAYLGEHQLAQLRIVQAHLDVKEDSFVTHLDRGRALQDVLTTALEKLKPPGPQPSPPTREWHQYVILHDSYVLGELNRDIMAKLYVGEGTFNRARRRAIRGVARALEEMETSLVKRQT
ncbi:MAG: GAF domain-containing protein [Chloroflexi bacterium]|nr:GAF domain-containing protein [Chloroflexota bacterium]